MISFPLHGGAGQVLKGLCHEIFSPAFSFLNKIAICPGFVFLPNSSSLKPTENF
jgi:hypothetical protein